MKKKIDFLNNHIKTSTKDINSINNMTSTNFSNRKLMFQKDVVAAQKKY